MEMLDIYPPFSLFLHPNADKVWLFDMEDRNSIGGNSNVNIRIKIPYSIPPQSHSFPKTPHLPNYLF